MTTNLFELDRAHPVLSGALSAHVGILGKTGAGKSYSARGLVERLLDEQRRVIIIDPTGVWWGLRSSADGKADGYAVAIFGGEHADVPLSDSAGGRLGSFLAERSMSAIIDVSEFSNNGQRVFMEGFLDALYQQNKRPLHLVIDEADAFAPQSSLPEMRRVLGHMSKIVRRGRVKGFRIMMITQRPATIHKDVFTQINALMALRVTAPQDRKAIEDWVKGQADAEAGKAVLNSLAQLNCGEGWIWAPELDVLKKVKFPRIKTFDSMKAPEEGEIAEPETLADVDVSALIADLGAEPEQSETSAKIDIEAIKRTAREEGRREGYAEGMAAGLRQAVEAVESVRQGGAPAPMQPPHATEQRSEPRPAKSSSVIKGENPLVALAERIWPVRLTWGALCALDGRKARGGHFNTQKKQAIESGLLREENGLVIFSNPPAIPSGQPADLLAANLPGSARDMFIALRERSASSWDELTARLGRKATGGHFNTGRKILLDNDLVVLKDGRLAINPNLERA